MSTPDCPNLDALLTTAESAHAVGVRPPVIASWRNRGYLNTNGDRERLPVAGYDRAGNPQHRYRDVLRADRITRRSHRSHRQLAVPQAA